MDTNDKFLPIGSVVLLKGGTKKAMVTGFCSVAEEDTQKMYDYTGCVYPEGFLDFDQVCLFDHNQIEKVYHVGYSDEEEQEFKKALIEIANKFESGEENTTEFFNEYVGDDDEDDETEEEDSTDESSDESPEIPVVEPVDIKLEDVQRNKIDNLEYL